MSATEVENEEGYEVQADTDNGWDEPARYDPDRYDWDIDVLATNCRNKKYSLKQRLIWKTQLAEVLNKDISSYLSSLQHDTKNND
jgi:hypothetical protein